MERLIKKIEGYNSTKISLESRFVDDLGYSSFDFVCLCSEIEDIYSLTFGLDEIADIVTVGELLQRVEGCIKINERVIN